MAELSALSFLLLALYRAKIKKAAHRRFFYQSILS